MSCEYCSVLINKIENIKKMLDESQKSVIKGTLQFNNVYCKKLSIVFDNAFKNEFPPCEIYFYKYLGETFMSFNKIENSMIGVVKQVKGKLQTNISPHLVSINEPHFPNRVYFIKEAHGLYRGIFA